MAEAEAFLRLSNITKQFGKFTAVNGVDLDIREGEFFTIVGPSGSGKTTLLRMLAGLERPSAGDVYLRGQRITGVPANRRPSCMVFQSLALFHHRTVGQNIEFSLKMRRVSRAARKQRAMELLDMLQLPADYYAKNVTKCSGGERQRVALARALASDPEILFFDEPLSAIDYRLRKLLEVELKDLHRRTGKTFMYITHSLEEAMVMSDRIGIMREGQIIQIGSPNDIYTRPQSRFVSQFMGEVNVLAVTASGDKLEASDYGASLTAPADRPSGFEQGHLVIRPESIRFVNEGASAENQLTGVLYNEYAMGSRVQYHVRVGEEMFTVEKLREQAYAGSLNDEVTIGWDAKDSVLVAD